MKNPNKEEVWQKISETEEQRFERILAEMIKDARTEIAKLELDRKIDGNFKTTI